MTSSNKKRKKTLKIPISAILFILISTGLLILSIKEINDYTYKNKNYEKTEAEVIKHTYDNNKITGVVLEYTVDEYKYTVKSTNKLDYIKSYGATVTIKYNPEKPEDIIYTNRSINIVTPIIAIVLLAIGSASIIVTIAENFIKLKRLTKIITNKNTSPNNSENTIGIKEAINKNYVIKDNSNKQNNNNIPKEKVDIVYTNKINNKDTDTDKDKDNNKNYNITEPKKNENIIKPKDKEENFLDIEMPQFIPNIESLKKKRQ